MYNRYLDQYAHRELTEDTGPLPGNSIPPPSPQQQNTAQKSADLLGDITSGLGDFLGGLLKNVSLSNLDAGDILLVLIMLFLFLEGDNLELVITLGLMLLLGSD